MEEPRLEELEALQAIFGEDAVEVDDPDLLDPTRFDELAISDLQVCIRLTAGSGGDASTVRLHVGLPPGYPVSGSAGPTLRLSSDTLARAALEPAEDALRLEAAARAGEVCVYALCMLLQEELLPGMFGAPGRPQAVREVVDMPNEKEDAGSVADEGSRAAAVVRLDHMNDAAAYCKKLREWARQEGLHGALFFRIPEKSGRWEDIFLFLVGASDGAVSSFLSNLRTHHVDRNSKGVKCKERQSDVLFRGAPGLVEGGRWPWERASDDTFRGQASSAGGGAASEAGLQQRARAALLPDWDYSAEVATQQALAAALAHFGVEPPMGVPSTSAVCAAPNTRGRPARDTSGGCFLSVAVKPNAKHGSQITNLADLRRGLADCVRADVAAAPQEGEANRELCALLAGALRVPRASVSVARGGACRDKEVFVQGVSASEALSRLTPAE